MVIDPEEPETLTWFVVPVRDVTPPPEPPPVEIPAELSFEVSEEASVTSYQ